MRNQEAARYARWAAMTAGAITLVVAGFYAERAVRGYLAQRHGPAPVPETVHQQSAGVSYSFSNQSGTTFTIRASHATQFKEGDRALLQDVWVTIYGKKGDRNDNIHTTECSYAASGGNIQADAGAIQCTGQVDIDLQPAGGAQGAPATQPLHVTTSNVTFDRKTGKASTPAPVNLTFAGGQGHGVGLDYDSDRSILRLKQGVQIEMAASEKSGGVPVSATAANMEFHRDDHTIALGGPVDMHQGGRELTAQSVAIGLDERYRAQTIVAQGNPVLRGEENGSAFTVAAQELEAQFDASGVVKEAMGDGTVTGTRKSPAGEDHFSAAHVEFAMVPGHNLIQTMTATGGVSGESQASGAVRTLKTEALRLTFAPPAATSQAARGQASTVGATSPASMDAQHIRTAETLAPATIESKATDETLNLKAARFVASFGADGKLQELLGQSAVQIKRTPANGLAQMSASNELAAAFGPGGDWSTLDETGNVHLAEGTKQATAGHAQVVQQTDTIVLDQSPVFTDGASRTTAGSVTINQKTGEIRATGGVVSTETEAASTAQTKGTAPSISLGEGAAHLSGDTLTGSTTSGDVVFHGHARLWQGQSLLDADQIEVQRDQNSLQATGHVVAVFPQAPGQGPQLPAAPPAKAKTRAADAAGPVVWQVHAQRLTYSNNQSMAHLEGGVEATSSQGSLHSQTLDLYLASAAPAPAGSGRQPTANQPAQAALGGRGLQRAVAQGDVTVAQNGAHGKADQADYDAARETFVFSGGRPTITDADGNTFSGHSLTFYVASDTISIDSDEGSRTLTRHRVEK